MTTTALPHTASAPTSGLSLSDLAGAAKTGRNRAVDFYRAIAMLAVSFGHWAAIAISTDEAGGLVVGNALEYRPGLSWITWILQVMPLFFVVGGFSSAMSLDSHAARDGRPQDWVIARLRRMLAPTVVLGGTWLAAVAIAMAVGVGNYALLGLTAAAIPLWFLANYTIDTAIAPYVLPLFRKNPRVFMTFALGLFGGIEISRFAGIPYLPQVNWVLGWLLFQIAGFAWRDGMLPTGTRMLTISGGLWTTAIAAVAFGPWPVSMVNFPGLTHSPTAPPTIALLLFGAAYSSTAIAIAPTISAWLTRNTAAWKAVVAANSVALTVYLWHFTAAVAAVAILFGLGVLPTAAVGSFSWWIQKLPMTGLSMLILAAIVAAVSKVERRALLAPRSPWNGGQASMLAMAAVVSASVKLWTHGSTITSLVGCAVLCLAWKTSIKPAAASERQSLAA